MRKALIVLFALAFVGPVLAQEPVEEPPPIVEASHNAVVAFLELTPEQETAWDEMYQIHRDAEQPIQEDIREVQEAIDALFDAGDPDPAEVGELFIERRALGEELIEVHVIYHEDFVALLDADQLVKLHFIARADDVQRIIPAFKLFELIRRR
jgi:Spy/CpxP family protein refolding chaperone